MFSQEPRCIYKHNQIAEVICQLRFPEILSISARLPVDFQEAIRDEFPIYTSRKEMQAPKVSGALGNLSVEKQEPTINYQFATADGLWRVNLTSKFVSLACTKYTSWEDFAARLDKPLVAFIKIYKPAHFERVGLRYVNFISRNELDLQSVPYSELIRPCYLGPLNEDDVSEQNVFKCSVDADIGLRGGCRAKIHGGPGLVKRNGRADSEVKFVFDQDIYMSGNIPVNGSVGALQTLHAQADSVFRGAITDRLHEAMEPQNL